MTPGTRSADSATDAPLRVLVVMPLGTALGGGEQMLRQLLRHGHGVEWIVVFLRDGPMIEETRALGIESHLLVAGRFRDFGKRAGAVRRIAALARERRVHLVLGWMAAGQIMAGAAAWLARLPCAWFQVGTPRPDWLDRIATRLPARGVLVLSRQSGEAQARLRPARRQRLVYPGTSLEAFDPAALPTSAELRRRLGLPATGALIGMVGRLQRWNGMHVLIEAMPAVLRAHPAAQAVIVGGVHETEPDYAAQLVLKVRGLGLEDAVRFVGYQANTAEWMQAMDVVVHASDREPFGIVVIEAMALGKPVVAGREGGPAEIVTDGVDGLLAPYGDAAALAGAICRYLDDPAFAARCGAAARLRAAAFGDRRYASETVAALRSFVDTPC
jgi:glycosyltransferase involved in cell wall biosynthesis